MSKVCSARADAATSPFFRAHWCSASWCLRVGPACPMYTLGQPLQSKEYTTPFCWSQWYWVFGAYQHVAEGAQWTKDHLDVQLCEDPSHCLRETIDVGQGYSCSRFPDIHFLSVPRWTRVLANEAGGVTILFKCIYNLHLLHSLYTWGWQCVCSGHEGPHYIPLPSVWLSGAKQRRGIGWYVWPFGTPMW